MSSEHVQVGHVPAIPVAIVRRQARTSDLPRIVPEGCGLVWAYLRSQQLKGGRNVAIYRDGSIRLEIGVEMDRPFTVNGDIVASTTPAGLAASIVHFGPYHTLAIAHAAIRDWCAGQHHRLAGPSWELYGHWQPEWDDHPSRIRTDIFYQLVES